MGDAWMEMSSDRGSTPRRSIDLNLCKSRICRGFSLLKMRKIVVLNRFRPFQTAGSVVKSVVRLQDGIKALCKCVNDLKSEVFIVTF